MEHASVIPIKIGNIYVNVINLYETIQSERLISTAHMHECFEMHIVLKGSAKIKVMDEVCDISKNNVLILPPHFTHKSIFLSDDYKSAIFSFDFSPVDKASQNKCECAYFFNTIKPDIFYLISLSDYERSIVDIVLKNTNNFTIYSINKVNIEISNLMLEIVNKIASTCSNDNSQISLSSNEAAIRKYKIERYIHTRIINGKHPSLDELSEELFFSKRHTERLIKQIFNTTFKKLYLKNQMILAKSLLNEGKLSIEKIAYQVGFSSYNGFLSAYKKYFGSLPSQKKF